MLPTMSCASLVPINRKHPIAELMEAVDRYTDKTSRRVSFEYALMSGINDSDEIADEFARLIRGRLCHVNLIPYNPVDLLEFERPSPERINRFAEIVGSFRHSGHRAVFTRGRDRRRLRSASRQPGAKHRFMRPSSNRE